MQCIRKLSKSGLNFIKVKDKVKIINNDITKLIDNIKKQTSNEKISNSYKLDFYTILKGLDRHNIVVYTAH